MLLTIFGFCVLRYGNYIGPMFFNKGSVESWQSLVHVCRRWRDVVFESPRRLNLHLCCSPGRSAKMSLDFWPALPLIILSFDSETEVEVDEIVPKLRHSNRISHICLRCFTILQIENVWAAMQVPFPELESLHLSNAVQSVQVLPDSFLGGSAPRLRY